MQLTIPDKLSFVLLAWTCAFLVPWAYNIPLVILLVILPFVFRPFKAVTKKSQQYFFRFLAYSALVVIVLVIVNGLLIREGPSRFNLVIFSLYDGGLQYGLTVSIRLIVLSLSILVFFTSIHFQDFAKYLESAGLPHSLVSIILLTTFFLEQLPNRISRVFTAQEARGAPVRAGIIARSRALFLVLSPLVLSSIVESVERGEALELRGYNHFKGKKESQQQQPASTLWRYTCISLSVIIMIIFVFHWLLN